MRFVTRVGPHGASKVHVIVYLIHWDRPKWCVAAVGNIKRSLGISPSITIVNNDLHSGSILSNVLPRDGRILQMPRNIGYAGGANAALADWLGRATDDEVCVLGSHDMHVAPEALRRLMREAAAHTDYGVLSPAQISPVANSGGMWTGKAALLAPEVPSCEGILERDWASGTCLVVRAACARQTGGFDASLHSYMEDVDFCLRAKDAGWRVGVVPSAIAWGLGSASDDAMSMIEANTGRLGARR